MREFKSILECLDSYLEALNVASELNEISKFCKVTPKQITVWRFKLPGRMSRVRLTAFFLSKDYKIKNFEKSGLRSKIIFLLGYDLVSLDDFIKETNFKNSTELFTFLFYQQQISEERFVKIEKIVQAMEVDKLLEDFRIENLRNENMRVFLKDFEFLSKLLKKMQSQLKELSGNDLFGEKNNEMIKKMKRQQNVDSFSFSEISDSLHTLLELVDTPVLNPV